LKTVTNAIQLVVLRQTALFQGCYILLFHAKKEMYRTGINLQHFCAKIKKISSFILKKYVYFFTYVRINKMTNAFLSFFYLNDDYILAAHEEKTGNSTSRREFKRTVDVPSDVQISLMRSTLSRDGILSITAPIRPPHYLPGTSSALQSNSLVTQQVN